MIEYKIDTAGCINAFGHPKISWVNSKEPDMLRSEGFRRYKIFRAYSNSPSELPGDYVQINTHDSYSPGEISSYTDTSAIINCSSLFHQETGYLRYKIAAVDKYDSVSVLSDFASIQGSISTIGINNHSIPLKFSISNYPNPFNPVAVIKYSIPKNIHVTIKIFNIIGQELLSLVDENKTTGEYIVKFDGTNYSSGVYFCRIEAGDPSRGSEFSFTETKKMLLIK